MDLNNYLSKARGKLTDESQMPFGKYRALKLKDVPANYLLWLGDENLKNHPKLRQYIEENRTALEIEADEQKET